MNRIFKPRLAAPALFGAALAASLLAGATPAAAEDCKPHAIDLGEGKSVQGGCAPLKIAFLSAATNNLYLQAGIKGAKDAAEKYGVTVDVFDANWDPATQFNQAQNAITGGQYNAILAEMNDGNQACAILSKDAMEKNVLVAVANGPLCGKASEEGEALWTSGTLTFIGGSQGRAAFRDWILGIAMTNPGKQKVAVITGPDLNANTINTDLAIEDVKKQFPQFEIVGVARTDYSVLQGNQKILPLLQANPDLTILVSNYSDMTRGAIAAVKQAGMGGKLKIYDYGGNGWAFEALKADQITATRMLTPYTEMYKGVEALAKAWKGEDVPRFIPLETAEVTKDNLATSKSEF
ncbi:MAG: sugar ABC transporter substrate-binding protein [Rhizobiales bacterium]|nr:sugar ABC transporter substrate-binding protein [Hyphomicrobiales bacterium]